MDLSLFPKLAFDILSEELCKCSQNNLTQESLEKLYSFFGETLSLSLELLDKCKVIEYTIKEEYRNVYKVVTRSEQYTIYDNINFCTCNTFRYKVLEERSMLTCKHVLATNIAVGLNKVTKEIVTPSQLEEFLNEQINTIEDK